MESWQGQHGHLDSSAQSGLEKLTRSRSQLDGPSAASARDSSLPTSSRNRRYSGPAGRATVIRVSPWTAQRLGAIVGAGLAIAGVIWFRTRATPCPGAVTLEFHPPLTDRGSYHIQLSWEGANPCALTVVLPLDPQQKTREKSGCGMALQLRTQVQDTQVSLAGLTFAAAPASFRLQVKRDSERIYDTLLEPKFAPYATPRAEDKHFCGERALVLPPCLRGSSQCAPFPVRCSGPEECQAKQACCLTPEWGRDFGPHAASECTSTNNCLAHLGRLACHKDGDCPAGMRCDDASLASDFSKQVWVCQNR